MPSALPGKHHGCQRRRFVLSPLWVRRGIACITRCVGHGSKLQRALPQQLHAEPDRATDWRSPDEFVGDH